MGKWKITQETFILRKIPQRVFIHFQANPTLLSFMVSVILVDLLGLVICLIFFFFLIRSMKYSFNLKKVTTEKAYNHWEKNTNNYTPLSTMNSRAQQHFWVCILTFLGSLFLGSSGGLIKRREITCGFWAGKSLGQRRKHLKTQNPFLASENHWETCECSTEEGAGLKEQTTTSTDELLPFSVPKLTRLTATGIWKPVSSSLLSSSDPPRQAPQCFTKTPSSNRTNLETQIEETHQNPKHHK